MALAVCAALPVPAVAYDEPVFLFTELTDEDLQHIDLHDGRVDDWLEVVGEPTLTARQACHQVFATCNPEYDPSDLDFRIWLAWHDESDRLYLAMDRLDDVYVNQYDRNCVGHNLSANLRRDMIIWDGSISLLVDGDRSGDTGFLANWAGMGEYERASLETGGQQQYYALAETHDSGPHVIISRQSYADWMLHPPYSDGSGRAFSQNPVVTVLEFYFTPFDHLVLDSPETSVASQLYPGKAIGFDIRVQDYPEDVTYRSDPTPTSITQLELLPHGIMVGRDQVGQGLDQFTEATWATVKHASAVDSSGTEAPGD